MSRDDDRGGRRRDDDARGSRSRDRDEDRGRPRGRDDDRTSSRGSSRGGSRSSFQYQRRDDDDVKGRAQGNTGDFDRLVKPHIKLWSPADGDNRIRIIPPTWEGAKHYGLDLHVHYGVGADRGSYLCLKKMLKKDDPIHEAYEEARRDGDEEYAKELASRRRTGIFLIDRNNEKEGVQFWAMPQSLDTNIVKVTVDKESGEVLPIDHPEEGYDVSFEKTGKGVNTKYLGVSIGRNPRPLGKDEWLEYAMDNPLPDQLVYYDYDHIAKAFGGGGGAGKGGGNRDREEDRERSRDRGEDRSGNRDRERGREDDRERARDREPELSYESIHEMTKRELEDLIDDQRLEIDPREAKDTEDLADWVCEEMKLEKKSQRRRVEEEDSRGRSRERDEPPARRRVLEDERDDGSASERLRRMRQERG